MSTICKPYRSDHRETDSGITYYTVLDGMNNEITGAGRTGCNCDSEAYPDLSFDDAELIASALNAYEPGIERIKQQRDELRAALKQWVDYFDLLDDRSIPGDPLAEARRKHHAKRMEVSRKALARSAPHNAKATGEQVAS